VLLLVYNRYEYTRRVFERIRQAQPGRLYVAADGPRPEISGDDERCAEVRQILSGVDWQCDVKKLFRERNLGLRAAVSSALDWFFAEEPEGIILEDDCLPSLSFFAFCEALLRRFRDEPAVMMISGTNYAPDIARLKTSYCFSRYFSIWGWASWRRVWQLYDPAMQDWPARKAANALQKYYADGFMNRHVSKTFDLAYGGRVSTWDTQLFYTCLFHGGLAVVPAANLISNIGSVGTHSASAETHLQLEHAEMNTEHLIHPAAIAVDEKFDSLFFRKIFRPTWRQRAKDLLRPLWRLISQQRA
jgi:hypothetical protein